MYIREVGVVKKWIGLALVFLLVGCNADEAAPSVAQDFTGNISEIEATVKKEERIQARQLVAAEDTVLVTYEVKPQYRVLKQQVEKDLQEQLEKAYPTLQFVVSGDFKLHYEARQLAKKEQKQSTKKEADPTEEKSIKKEIEQLKKLAEEET